MGPTYSTRGLFRDRRDAGRRLARAVAAVLSPGPVVVLGLPRGGVVVAVEVARALGAPLDVIVVRKLGVPVQPELAMGAIGEDGVRVLSAVIVARAGVSPAELASVELAARDELERRVARLRRGQPRRPLAGRIALVVDDGIATGSTARAACEVVRAAGAARVVLAVPVAPATTIAELAGVADDVVCPHMPSPFVAVGQWYDDFSPISDDDVAALLEEAATGEAR
jgi:putative phosphoribosyl transferase